MRKTITFLRKSVLAAALILASVNAQSQTPSNGGFENGSTGWTLATSTGTSVSVGTASPRTGLNSLIVNQSASDGTKFQTSTTSIDVAANAYVHVIGWMKNNSANGKACFSGIFANGLGWNPGGGTIAGTYTRYSGSKQNTTATTFICRLKTEWFTGATTIYVDDVITYSSTSSTTDLTKPGAPSNITNVSTTTSSASFAWTNGTDSGTGSTGVQSTIILRTTNTSAATPVLNDQAIYSVAGGITGPNTVGDWTVINTSIASGIATYTDNTCSDGTSYKYAVVHRDMAYNYSAAFVSGTIITATDATPTKLAVSITPSSLVFGSLFSVTIQAQTEAGVAASVTSDTEITLAKASGTGTLGGTLTGTITNGTNSVTISGVSYDTAETGVSISATATTGMTGLTAATSITFTVVEAIPSTKASAVALVSKTSSEISLSWTNGNGAGRIAVARLSASPAVAPTPGTIYTANSSSFTDGLNSTTGAGNIVIYNGTGSAVTVTDLASSTGHVIDVYEYSSNTNIANYTTTSALGYTPTYAVEPTVQASDVTFSNVALTSMTINCTAGDGANRIIVVKAGSAVDAAPVDGTYIASYNAAFGTSTALGTGNYVVSRTGNSVNVTGLTPNTTYYVSVWEYNGAQAPTNYLLTSPATASQSTLSTITVGASTNLSTLPVCPTCDLTVNNGMELTVDESRTYNTLTISAGGKVTNDIETTTTLTISNDFTIESDVNGTGTYVEKRNGALSVGGTTTVKQYLTTAVGGRNWFVSSPVESASSNVVKSTVANKLWSYTEANSGTVLWDEITDTDTPLAVMGGYVAKPAADGVIEFTGGALNTGSKTSPTLTNTGTVSTGFNLVGNPYPSYINWSDATKNNVSTSIWYRSKSTGAYLFQTYNVAGTGIGANGGSELIPPMQSFWVKATGTGASVTFENAARSHQDQSVATNRLKTKSVSNQQVLRLQISAGEFKDEAVVYFNDNASNEFDQYDSQKMWNNDVSIPELYTKVGGTDLVINGMKSVADNLQLDLGFKTGQYNTFTIQATEIKSFEADKQIVLIDKVLNQEKVLTETAVYEFTSDEVNTMSRFSLAFRSPSITTSLETPTLSMSMIKYANNQLIISSNSAENGKISIYNALGQKVKALTTTGNSTLIKANLEAGVYIITLEAGGAKSTKKIILN